jgi:signal transduction histidine kinase
MRPGLAQSSRRSQWRRTRPGGLRSPTWLSQLGVAWWQPAVAGAAVVAAVAAVWLTLEADFLAYPGWLAAQKADFILGPVFIGLYWMRRRPQSRFGPMLIAFGFIGALYVPQSSSNPWLYGTGLLSENVIYLATLALILTFPSGRFDGLVSKAIMGIAFFGAAVPASIIVLVLPQVGAGGSISGCSTLCPQNALAFTTQPSLALDLSDVYRPVGIGLALATGVLLIVRFVKGTPPQRRALAIGTPIALLFLAFQAVFLSLTYAAPHVADLRGVIQWTFVGARAALWYGFLFALIAAQLFAGRALHQLVRQSLRRPSRRELEAMLREPLADPDLQLSFWDSAAGTWRGEAVAETPVPDAGRTVTFVEREGSPAVAIRHDAQLDDDPELLQAAGAVALLAADSAELDAEWNRALRELQRSRARIVRVGDDERRRFERNLHDGVQQQLIALQIKLELAREAAAGDSAVDSSLHGIADGVEQALEQVREVSHGLYPPALSDWGLAAALGNVQMRPGTPLRVDARGVGRYSPELESAVYYCCLEAIQNATKHGGSGVHIWITLRERARELWFEVADDGPGFDLSRRRGGMGLQNMQDRLGALDGHLSIDTAPGEGTVVAGSLPLRDRGQRPDLHVLPDGGSQRAEGA